MKTDRIRTNTVDIIFVSYFYLNSNLDMDSYRIQSYNYGYGLWRATTDTIIHPHLNAEEKAPFQDHAPAGQQLLSANTQQHAPFPLRFLPPPPAASWASALGQHFLLLVLGLCECEQSRHKTKLRMRVSSQKKRKKNCVCEYATQPATREHCSKKKRQQGSKLPIWDYDATAPAKGWPVK